jgi:hypothetical protein
MNLIRIVAIWTYVLASDRNPDTIIHQQVRKASNIIRTYVSELLVYTLYKA